MKSFQFELWQECNNLCKFCFLGTENRKTDKNIKIQNLKKLLSYLNDRDFISQYDNISIIGGEFFQGQLSDIQVKSLFLEVIQKIFDFLDENPERSSWIAATLTIGDQKDLYEILELYSKTKTYQNINMKDSYGLWICTSYDTIGRFHTKEANENWKFHMKRISELYPNVKKNTCSIITNDLTEKYINNDFTFSQFCEEYKTQVFLKPPDLGSLKSKQDMEDKVNGFFPLRKNGLKFLSKLYMEEPWIFPHIMNINLRADLLVKSTNTGTHIDCERDKKSLNEYNDIEKTAPCGHSTYYQCYIDSDACIKCDLLKILE